MYHFMWLTLNWPWPVFVIAVVVSIAAFFVVTRITGALALSLVLYLGASWSLWSWVPPVFWILWLLGVVGYLVYLATQHLGSGAALFGSSTALALVLVLVFGSGIAALWNVTFSGPEDATSHTAPKPKAPTATVTTTTTVDLGLSPKDSAQIAQDLSKIYQGYQPGQVKAGTDNVPDKTREAATQAFSGKTLKNRAMLSAFLKSNDKLARQARQRIRHALLSNGYDQAEVKRALANADHWFWVAPSVASQISGTTYPLGGKVVKERGARGVAPNDAIWFYVTSDAHVLRNASVRADCGNPEVTTVTPIPPGHIPPPISQPPCIKPSKPAGGGAYVYNSTTCTWHKPGQTFDEMQNQSQAHQDVQDNSTSGVNTGHTSGASTPPKPQPTQPASTATAPPDGGANGGSTSNPVVSGTPSPDDTSTHSTPIPTPTGGPFGG